MGQANYAAQHTLDAKIFGELRGLTNAMSPLLPGPLHLRCAVPLLEETAVLTHTCDPGLGNKTRKSSDLWETLAVIRSQPTEPYAR